MAMRNTRLPLRLFLAFCLAAVPAGCGSPDDPPLAGDERMAAEYLEAENYRIESRLGETGRYVLDREYLAGMPGGMIWGVQQADPAEYIGKTIVSYGFLVSQHPLEKTLKTIDPKDYVIRVDVLVADGHVIGGTSFPVPRDGKNGLAGAPYSLDGRTLEEVTGKRYGEWSDEWFSRFGRDH